MISNLDPFASQLSLYLAFNWFFALFTSGWFIAILVCRRYLFVKPSIFLLFFSHIFFQWPLAIFSTNYETYHSSYLSLAILIHTYIIVGLFFSGLMGIRSARRIWLRITEGPLGVPLVHQMSVFVLTSIIAGVMVAYFNIVPFTETGLWAVLFAPENSTLAREQSLKLLESTGIKYAYTFVITALAPLLTAILTIVVVSAFKRKMFFKTIVSVAIFSALVIVVSITGARFPAVQLLFIIFFTVALRRKLPLAPQKYLPFLAVVLLPAVAISILREGRTLEFSRVIDYWFQILYRRVLVDPLDQGILYLYYTDLYGRFGIAAIPKIAKLVGIEPVNSPQLVGLMLTKATASSINANAGYLLTYFSYFGWLSLPLSIVLLWCLDLSLVVQRTLHQELLLPCVAALNAATLSFVQSDFTTVLLSQGFLIIILVAFITDRMAYFFARRRVRRDLQHKGNYSLHSLTAASYRL